MQKYGVVAMMFFLTYIPVLLSQTVDNFPRGFASVFALGCEGTSGGQGGSVITITNADTLYKYLRSLRPDKNPKLPRTIFEIVGTVPRGNDKMIYLKGNANITFIGRGTNAKIDGWGLKIQGSSNIVIRNIEFANSPDDAICVEEASHHIWIDHCTFTNAYDGLIDIKTQSQYVTVSWCRFYNHSKTSLVGHDDGEIADTVLSVTYHHCWWDKTEQRQPRVRFGKVHLFNNYHVGHKYYGIASTCNARVYVEGCYFKDVQYPMHVGYAESSNGYIMQLNNIFENCGIPITDGKEKSFGGQISNPHSWNPNASYSYTIDDPTVVPTLVMQYAGNGTIQIPVTTDIENAYYANPVQFETLSNYPNPCNPTTTIQFTVREQGLTSLCVVDVRGRYIATLFNGIANPSEQYTIVFDAANIPSGVYFAILRNKMTTKSIKMIVTK
ncbi:MAG: right-handed parallel beta-helix repeat-containing protein [Bacteroidetes bacterium]|nr:right-handed parallel beta-helix repeat-containing protein [Bacteroidota bacterium]